MLKFLEKKATSNRKILFHRLETCFYIRLVDKTYLNTHTLQNTHTQHYLTRFPEVTFTAPPSKQHLPVGIQPNQSTLPGPRVVVQSKQKHTTNHHRAVLFNCRRTRLFFKNQIRRRVYDQDHLVVAVVLPAVAAAGASPAARGAARHERQRRRVAEVEPFLEPVHAHYALQVLPVDRRVEHEAGKLRAGFVEEGPQPLDVLVGYLAHAAQRLEVERLALPQQRYDAVQVDLVLAESACGHRRGCGVSLRRRLAQMV